MLQVLHKRTGWSLKSKDLHQRLIITLIILCVSQARLICLLRDLIIDCLKSLHTTSVVESGLHSV